MTAVSYESELERTGQIIITIQGTSMRPLFRAGSDAIIVKQCPADTLKNLDIVLFRRAGVNGEQYVLHRIVGKQDDGRFIIAGDNCLDADIVSPEDILGVAVSAQRGSIPVPLSGIRYAAYAKLWCAPYKMRFAVLRMKNRLYRAAKKITSRRR